ncbi:conjugative transposon protein TraM [Labilibaculum sp. DW002]|uniref:Conjugative transposon protein TraM n=1 Tax=Paralabilibaculum antarcticum TaxID=2912572 RepID=A0ABT5VQ83_9BACT|nr:conjugative transposon protein TraM [Labilibaculum sp. DW002]MDE5417592.1 conjugative transposon protein TraM [Labilibaculum sp. DW002]
MRTYLQKNKALLILPIVLLPFVILIFYILGGGEKALKQNALANNKAEKEGANYFLPEAEKSIEIFDKMEAYQQQDLAVQLGNENAQQEHVLKEGEQEGSDSVVGTDSLLVLLQKNQKEDVSAQLLAHIRQKEILVRNDLEKEASPCQKKIQKSPVKKAVRPIPQEKQGRSKLVDSETGLEELEEVFDENISLNQENDSLKFYLEQTKSQLFQLKKQRLRSFTLEKKEKVSFNGKITSNSMIRAEIYESSKVLNGNRIKMRLLEDAWLDGRKVLENSFLYGICKINNERLYIRVSNFPVADYFLPVNLEIHDLDGLPGLYIPDNVSRRVSKEVGSRTNASSLWGMSNDPIANMGISAADQTTRSLLKRVRLKKVSIKKNTLVYLISKKQ